MRISLTLAAGMAVLSAAGSGAWAQPVVGTEVPARHRISDGWRFAPGDVPGAERADFDDTEWQPVDLPHTWNAEDALDGDGEYRRGVGWYRKAVSIFPERCGRQRPVFLLFEGANQTAEVWLNGDRLGRHAGGYTAFAVEATASMRCDRPNVIAVRVDNSHDPDIPPLDADFTFYGGIYRDVWLITTGLVFLDRVDAGSHVLVDTPEVSAERARVRVRGRVAAGWADMPLLARIVHRVVDADGDTVATFETPGLDVIYGRDPVPFESVSSPIERPRLWSPEDPYLYRVITEVYQGPRLSDRVETPLGFRWFGVDPDRGFLLNGEPRSLRGTNRHQDRAGFGNALPDSLHAEDVRIVKETGFDFLRLAHYPQDPAVLDAADSLGVLIWMEIPIVNRISMSPEFARNAERMLVEMIRQHGNHPSVVIWGYMNEVRLRDPEPMPAGYAEAVRELAERLDARAHAEDPTRPTAIAVSLNEIEQGTALLDVADVLGLNLYFGWYYRDLASLGGFLDSLHVALPERPLLVSEYGAGSDERVHAADPKPFDFSSEYIRVFHEATFPQLEARPWLVGSAVWNQFDFGSALRQDTRPSLNQKGLHFFDRRPKDVAWYYRAALLDELVLHIAADEWTQRAGSRPEDRDQTIAVYTNLDRVELVHDGVSLGTKEIVNRTARWTIELHARGNRLVALGSSRSADGVGNIVTDSLVIRYEDRTHLFDIPQIPPQADVLAVNAGADYAFVDENGTVWEPDRPYVEGSWGHVGGEPLSTHRRIAATGLEPLYQSARVGMQRYRFDVSYGRYEIELRLAEIAPESRAGGRVFDIFVNGVKVSEAIDPVAETGAYAALRLHAVVEGGEGIEVGFAARRGKPIVNGILIRRR